jgi:hypothetical protein
VAHLPTAVSLLLLVVLFMQISGVSLALIWSQQVLFTQSSLVHEPLLQAFLFPSTLGEVTLHLLSQACVFIYSSCRKWVFPRLLCSVPSTTAFISFPTPDCWVCSGAPAGWLVYLQLMWEVGLPPLLWSFPPSATLTSFPAPDCWACATTPTLSGQARLVYL